MQPGVMTVISSNQIHHQKASGIWLYQTADPVITENIIFENAYEGIGATDDVKPTIRCNIVHHNGRCGN